MNNCPYAKISLQKHRSTHNQKHMIRTICPWSHVTYKTCQDWCIPCVQNAYRDSLNGSVGLVAFLFGNLANQKDRLDQSLKGSRRQFLVAGKRVLSSAACRHERITNGWDSSGAGGAGPRAAFGLAEGGFYTAGITKLSYSEPYFGCPGWDQCSVGRTGICNRGALHQLEYYGVSFSRKKDGVLVRLLIILGTLYGHSLCHNTNFFIESFALDLIMQGGECVGVMALNMEDGTLHRFRAYKIVLATGGYGNGNAMVARAGLPLQDLEFVQFYPTGVYGAGRLIAEGSRGEGGYLLNSESERFMEHYASTAKDSVLCDVGLKTVHIYLQLSHLPLEVLHERLHGISEAAAIFAGVNVTKELIPICPIVHYNKCLTKMETFTPGKLHIKIPDEAGLEGVEFLNKMHSADGPKSMGSIRLDMQKATQSDVAALQRVGFVETLRE
ncbi:FAD binding domain-containing protein [Scleroderma citrinum]